MLKPIIIWGASGHAKVLREALPASDYEIIATFDSHPGTLPPFEDVPLFIGKEGFAQWRRSGSCPHVSALVAIGGSRGRDRFDLQQFLEDHGAPPLTVVHSTAFVAKTVWLGKGCQVLPQAAVCAEARLGDACIVNTSAGVDHECDIGRGVHLAPGARLAGAVQVAEFTLIAVGAVVLPRIKIGRDCIVGAGAVVTRDVPDNSVVIGNPARVVRRNP